MTKPSLKFSDNSTVKSHGSVFDMIDRLRTVLYPLALLIMVGALWAYAQARSLSAVYTPLIEHGMTPDGYAMPAASPATTTTEAAPITVATINADAL